MPRFDHVQNVCKKLDAFQKCCSFFYFSIDWNLHVFLVECNLAYIPIVLSCRVDSSIRSSHTDWKMGLVRPLKIPNSVAIHDGMSVAGPMLVIAPHCTQDIESDVLVGPEPGNVLFKQIIRC
jgi:hypothetical protein